MSAKTELRRARALWRKSVGCVERSDTHHLRTPKRWVSISLYPSYALCISLMPSASISACCADGLERRARQSLRSPAPSSYCRTGISTRRNFSGLDQAAAIPGRRRRGLWPGSQTRLPSISSTGSVPNQASGVLGQSRSLRSRRLQTLRWRPVPVRSTTAADEMPARLQRAAPKTLPMRGAWPDQVPCAQRPPHRSCPRCRHGASGWSSWQGSSRAFPLPLPRRPERPLKRRWLRCRWKSRHQQFRGSVHPGGLFASTSTTTATCSPCTCGSTGNFQRLRSFLFLLLTKSIERDIDDIGTIPSRGG